MFADSDEVLVVYCGMPVAHSAYRPATHVIAANAGSHCKPQQGQLLSLR
jgi:hypothetical protein